MIVVGLKDLSFMENQDSRSSTDGTDDGNWTLGGLRKSGRDYDEGECQLAIAGFIAEHRERSYALD